MQASARWLFSERTGNRIANKIFWALVREPDGLVANESSRVLHRNTPKTALDEALEALAKNGMACLEMKRIEKEEAPNSVSAH